MTTPTSTYRRLHHPIRYLLLILAVLCFLLAIFDVSGLPFNVNLLALGLALLAGALLADDLV